MLVLWASQMSVNNDSMIVIDNSRVTLQIVASLTDNSKGIIYNYNMFRPLVSYAGSYLGEIWFFKSAMKKTYRNQTGKGHKHVSTNTH